jgi:hypothetical protein
LSRRTPKAVVQNSAMAHCGAQAVIRQLGRASNATGFRYRFEHHTVTSAPMR